MRARTILLGLLSVASPALAATGQAVGRPTEVDVSARRVQATGSTTARALADRFADAISVKDFGAKGDGSADDTAAIQAAVNRAGLAFSTSDWFVSADPSGQPTQVVTFVAGGAYRIAGTVYVPQGVTLDFNGATLIGTGYATTDNVMFETGYYSGGALVSNWGAGDEAHRVVYTKFRNGRIRNCKIAFHLWNFNEGSAVEDVSFSNCRQNILAGRSFYSSYRRLMSRGTAGGATEAAWEWANGGATTVVNNVLELSSIATGQRQLAFKFSGGTAGLSMRNCTAENGVNGIVFVGEVTSLDLTGNYFEGLTGTAIDLTANSTHRAIHIGPNWFLTVNVGIAGKNLASGLIEPQGFYSGVTTKISIADDTASPIEVVLPQSTFTANGAGGDTGIPALPAGYTFGRSVRVRYPIATIDPATGFPRVRQMAAGGGANFIDLPYTGSGGSVLNGIPFATWVIDNTAGTLTVTTGIETNTAYNMGAFILTVPDNLATSVFRGRWWGKGGGSSPYTTPLAVLDDSTHGSRTVTASSVGGRLVLTFAGFSTPIGNPEGVIRMY